MKKVFAVVFALTMVCGLVGCGDDDAASACDQLEDATMGVLDSVCDDYPDCILCEDGDTDGGDPMTEDECQTALDALDEDALLATFTAICEM